MKSGFQAPGAKALVPRLGNQTFQSWIFSQKLLMETKGQTPWGHLSGCVVSMCTLATKTVVGLESVLVTWMDLAVTLMCGCVLMGLVLWRDFGCGLDGVASLLSVHSETLVSLRMWTTR